ncbi:MAG: winged helix-turn-helix domain-containing protein [Methanomicrobiaceae archaeon]|uniref:Uncharacterized protein n=1 Tax=hydrocarbon metagenome TaxID=938273 RepID=A0A0W8FEX4_9ZZZZ|nr:winged helix-turn-helix domain-containing protein [Methanomicrobiaceae archaeon]MDD5418617.1 winged helix-turn-helix domain-containing protein [Methanomicrobiaceae archaeon]
MTEENDKERTVQNTLRLAACSDLRRNVLLSLKEDRKVLKKLREELDVNASTAIHALRDLEKDMLVFQDEDRSYALTKIGEVIALKVADVMDAIDVLKEHEDFWLTHDLSGIPPHLLERIGWLKGATLLENPATDIFQVHESFVSLLAGARKIRGVSSIFVPQYPILFEELILKKKADVELIVTEDVLQKINKDILQAIFADEDSRLTLYMIERGAKAAFSVTDSYISLGLFYNDGTYDYNRDLVSSDPRAIRWGEELFEWYREGANLIER